MASPVRISRTLRAAAITVIVAAFAVLPGCYHDSAEPDPLLFTGPSAPVIVVGTLTPPTAAFVFTKIGTTVSMTVNFNGSTSTTEPGRTITNYAWGFGDGNTASGASPTTSNVYTTAASVNPALTVTDSAGLTASATVSVTIP